FATITAHTSQGDGSAIVAVVRKGTRHGRQANGDAKTDTGGNIYISDPRHNVIVRSSGTLDRDFAGMRDAAGFADGQGSAARFDGPTGLGVDNAVGGGVYVADDANNSIRLVSFHGAMVTTVLNKGGAA